MECVLALGMASVALVLVLEVHARARDWERLQIERGRALRLLSQSHAQLLARMGGRDGGCDFRRLNEALESRTLRWWVDRDGFRWRESMMSEDGDSFLPFYEVSVESANGSAAGGLPEDAFRTLLVTVHWPAWVPGGASDGEAISSAQFLEMPLGVRP
jgi:hypothetical protein